MSTSPSSPRIGKLGVWSVVLGGGALYALYRLYLSSAANKPSAATTAPGSLPAPVFPPGGTFVPSQPSPMPAGARFTARDGSKYWLVPADRRPGVLEVRGDGAQPGTVIFTYRDADGVRTVLETNPTLAPSVIQAAFTAFGVRA